MNAERNSDDVPQETLSTLKVSSRQKAALGISSKTYQPKLLLLRQIAALLVKMPKNVVVHLLLCVRQLEVWRQYWGINNNFGWRRRLVYCVYCGCHIVGCLKAAGGDGASLQELGGRASGLASARARVPSLGPTARRVTQRLRLALARLRALRLLSLVATSLLILVRSLHLFLLPRLPSRLA